MNQHVQYSRELEEKIVDSCLDIYFDPETVRKLGDSFIDRNKMRELMLAKMEAVKSEIFPLIKKGIVLDLGCGIPPNSLQLALYGFDVICFDKNPHALYGLKTLIQKYKVEDNVQLIQGDMENIPLTKKVDVTISFDGLVSKIGLPGIVSKEYDQNRRKKIVEQQQRILQKEIEQGLSRKFIPDYGVDADQVCIPYSVKAFQKMRRVTSKAAIIGVSCSDPFCNLFRHVKKIGKEAGFNSFSDVRTVGEYFKYMIIE